MLILRNKTRDEGNWISVKRSDKSVGKKPEPKP